MQKMDDPDNSSSQQRRRQVEERLRAVMRPFYTERAEAAARAGSCGLWKAPHVSQSCQWDCGVSCVQMVLRGLGREAERSSLLAALGTRSVWTIDLAMLLHRQGVRFTYGTRTAGVTEAYSAIDFYRDNFNRDAPRVQSLFKAAEEAKVGAVQKAFSWQELAVLVSSYNYAAIVLVDSRYLCPTSYRPSSATPVLAPPSPAAAAAPLISPSTTATGPTTAAVEKAQHGGGSGGPLLVPSSWSTPKRHREEIDEEGAGGWGPGEKAQVAAAAVAAAAGYKQACAEPSRRRRKIPTAPTVVLIDRSSSSADLTKRGEMSRTARQGMIPRSFSAHSALGATATPEPLIARDANVTKHLRVAPAPHARPDAADDGGEVEVAVFATPPTRQSARKSLARSPGGSVRAGGPEAKAPATASPAASIGGTSSCCNSPRPAVTEARASQPAADSAYCGHYILLVGWSETDGVFVARDPALPSSPSSPSPAFPGGGSGDSNAHVCIALTPEALDRARRSYGTDEDVLVVDLARSRRGGVPTAPLAALAATALAASASSGSSSAAASAVVGLLALAATAAAAGAEAPGFKWPDRAAWFGGTPTGDDRGTGGGGGAGGAGSCGGGEGGDGRGDDVGQGRGAGAEGHSGAESAARRLASLLSLAASGLRFPTVVGDGSRGPRVSWGTGAGLGGGSGSEAEEKEEHDRWAVRMASAMLSEGGRRAAYTMEGLLQGGRRAAYTMEGLLQGGAHTMEGLLQGGAHTMEGLLQGGRRAAYTMEGLLEGGRRAAYNLRDQLADVADAPGGAGAESCAVAVFSCPGSPVSTVRVGAAIVSPA